MERQFIASGFRRDLLMVSTKESFCAVERLTKAQVPVLPHDCFVHAVGPSECQSIKANSCFDWESVECRAEAMHRQAHRQQ